MKELQFTTNVYGKKSFFATIYPLKKDGTRYKSPMIVKPVGLEQSKKMSLQEFKD